MLNYYYLFLVTDYLIEFLEFVTSIILILWMRTLRFPNTSNLNQIIQLIDGRLEKLHSFLKLFIFKYFNIECYLILKYLKFLKYLILQKISKDSAHPSFTPTCGINYQFEDKVKISRSLTLNQRVFSENKAILLHKHSIIIKWVSGAKFPS